MTADFTNKLHAGSDFPIIEATLLSGEVRTLSTPENGLDWTMVVVYRGQHCPLCTRYLNQLESLREDFANTGVDLIAISGDSKEQLESHMEKLNISFAIAYGLTLEQMKALGLYISDPRSPQETDHPFAEPGLFVVNNEGKVHVVDISNNPFVRPELTALANGLAWIRNPDNNYPIRGMHK
ncbi:peroxiredoxin-like family protein [Thalassotalea ponticola]|uniref:peroxiredoxin-like family protein n=1 Tax=Thalassotalea ponticola TaxID=1523392 RepID=UPI0025B4006B|nr:peroxiredoxin-like family protein [Thalassotalea ponticola]MDN3652253.1 peroxiredoxin-like family protein [Thalassotalea ponticola]